jgi:hypothetical protein
MFNRDETKERDTTHTPLVDFYDDLNDVNNYLFFFCEAVSGTLSPDFALDAETINGIRLAADGLRQKSRWITNRLRCICDGARSEASGRS